MLLKVNAGNAATALREPTLGGAIQMCIREQMPERLKSQQNYRLLWTGTFSPNGREGALRRSLSPPTIESSLRELSYSPQTKRRVKA